MASASPKGRCVVLKNWGNHCQGSLTYAEIFTQGAHDPISLAEDSTCEPRVASPPTLLPSSARNSIRTLTLEVQRATARAI